MMPDKACKLFARWIIALFIALVALATCTSCFAQNFSQIHTYIEDKVNEQLAGFYVCDIVKHGYFSDESWPTLSIVCAVPSDRIVMSMALPATRESGTAMARDELANIECRATDTSGLKSRFTVKELN